MNIYITPTLNTQAIVTNTNRILTEIDERNQVKIDASKWFQSEMYGLTLYKAQVTLLEAEKWLDSTSLGTHFKAEDWANLEVVVNVLTHVLLTGVNYLNVTAKTA